MLYLYAITDSGQEPDLHGLGGARVRAIGDGRLAAIASEHEDLRLRPDEQQLWEHETVVEELMELGAVLPARMGSTVRGPESVLELLRERGGDFSRGLAHVRGAVEIGVRAILHADDAPRSEVEPPAPGAGAAYMRTLLDRRRRIDEDGERIQSALAPLARDHTPVRSSEVNRLTTLRAAYLVERDRVDEFVDAADRLDAESAGLTLACTGPWPPYSFTSGLN